ncbi:hypothetical protein OAQ86_06805 [Candidatus Pseudothioglobus singularis]|nr:hypothetical protein [Candidatus Pseudothioglobus singularis]
MSNFRKKFIEFNKSLWLNVPSNNEIVLVEGRPFVNQMLASSMAAKAVEEVFKIPTIVWLSSHQEMDIYLSFSIEKFIKKKKYFLQYFIYIFSNSISTTLKMLYELGFKRNKIEYFIDFYKLDGIRLGDLIYDTFIRNDLSFLNPNLFSLKFLKIFIYTMFEFYSIKHFFKKNNVKFAVVSKWQYTNSGALIARFALYNEIKVIHATFNQALLVSNYEHVFHDCFKVFNIEDSRLDENFLDKKIEERFSGEGHGIDIKSAFSNKIWDEGDLSSFFGSRYDRKKKNVFIMLHAFSDANHLSGKLIYRDYYKWFSATMEIISKLDNVNWIVKQHPSRKVYYEEEIVNNFFVNNDTKNILLLPDNFNTYSVFKLADSFITARGTIALEASLIGIPSILVGESNFSNLGFTYDMETVLQYESILSNIENVPSLNENEILLAKKAFYNYPLTAGSKLKNIDKSWVFELFHPSQSIIDRRLIEEDYFKRIIHTIGLDFAGKRNPYYKDILDALKYLKNQN